MLFSAMMGCGWEYGKVIEGVNSRKVQTLQVSRMESFSVRLELMFNFSQRHKPDTLKVNTLISVKKVVDVEK